MEINFVQTGAMQGWQCPICKRVLSPWTQECPCKGKPKWDKTVSDESIPYEEYTVTMHPASKDGSTTKDKDIIINPTIGHFLGGKK